MTIFRGEIGAWFLVMFFALLAGKVWGWIGEGRVETFEQQPPRNAVLFHSRLAVSLLLSVLFDTWMLEYVVKEVLQMARPDMMVMFGFEFAVLTVMSLSTLARYGISLVEILIVKGQKHKRAEEIRRERHRAREAQTREQSSANATTGTTTDRPAQTSTESEQTATSQPSLPTVLDEIVDESEIEVEGWEEKGRWIFYLDLTTDFLKLVIYLSFFFILLIFYGLPIHIMRDVFLTCRSFFKRIADFIRYRTATRDMDERYPDATAEEIGREDLCIICREEMKIVARPANSVPGQDAGNAQPGQQDQGRPRSTTSAAADRMRPKKLPCGHILHFSCLRSWLERQQICPTCRRPVLPTQRPRTDGAAAPAGPGGLVQGFQDGLAAGRQNREARNQQGNDDHAREGGNGYRGRVFQLGPLRIGVGAGRGNMYDDLVQRLHDGEPGPIRDQDANNGNNANRPQQYGLGFGFGRTRHRDRRRYPTSGNLVADALELAEQRLAQEIEDLRVASSELNVVRMLQAEMNRLRAQRQANATASITQTTSEAGLPRPTQTATAATATGFVADSRQNVVQSGSDALPQGLTLPEGWSMMPLQRMQPGTQLPQIAVAQPGMGNFGMAGHGVPNGQGLGFQGIPGQQPLPAFGGGYMAPNHFPPPPAPTPSTNVPHTAAAPTPQTPIVPAAQQEPATNQSNPTPDAATANIDQDVLDMFQENARLHEEILRTHHGMSDEEIAEHTHHHNHFHSTDDDEPPSSPQADSNSVTSPSLSMTSAALPDVHPHSPPPAYLPIWGSGAIPTPTTNGSSLNHSNTETSQDTATASTEPSSSTAVPNGETSQPGQSASSGKGKEARKPTVEDLVEGPD